MFLLFQDSDIGSILLIFPLLCLFHLTPILFSILYCSPFSSSWPFPQISRLQGEQLISCHSHNHKPSRTPTPNNNEDTWHFGLAPKTSPSNYVLICTGHFQVEAKLPASYSHVRETCLPLHLWLVLLLSWTLSSHLCISKVLKLDLNAHLLARLIF